MTTEFLAWAGGCIYLFSEAGQWKWLRSCHLGTDKTQQVVSQSRRKGLGSQGRSVVMASLFDLERRGGHQSQTALSLRAAAQFCTLFPLSYFPLRPTPSLALPSYCRACPGCAGDLDHTPFSRQFRWPAALREPGNSKMGFLRASRASCGLRSRLPDKPGGPSGFFLLYSRHLSA